MMTTEQMMTIERATREMLIRDLVEQYPDVMPVLQQHGIDICCGGGLTVPAAAEAHGHDADALLTQVRQVIRGGGE